MNNNQARRLARRRDAAKARGGAPWRRQQEQPTRNPSDNFSEGLSENRELHHHPRDRCILCLTRPGEIEGETNADDGSDAILTFRACRECATAQAFGEWVRKHGWGELRRRIRLPA